MKSWVCGPCLAGDGCRGLSLTESMLIWPLSLQSSLDISDPKTSSVPSTRPSDAWPPPSSLLHTLRPPRRPRIFPALLRGSERLCPKSFPTLWDLPEPSLPVLKLVPSLGRWRPFPGFGGLQRGPSPGSGPGAAQGRTGALGSVPGWAPCPRQGGGLGWGSRRGPREGPRKEESRPREGSPSVFMPLPKRTRTQPSGLEFGESSVSGKLAPGGDAQRP